MIIIITYLTGLLCGLLGGWLYVHIEYDGWEKYNEAAYEYPRTAIMAGDYVLGCLFWPLAVTGITFKYAIPIIAVYLDKQVRKLAIELKRWIKGLK